MYCTCDKTKHSSVTYVDHTTNYSLDLELIYVAAPQDMMT